MQFKKQGGLVLGLFFFSGATALVYEVVWSKFLAQMFGSTIYAQTVVLAAFMGGLALGNKLFGRWADGLRRPVRAYGVLEMAIGLYALLFPTLDRLADHTFVTLGSPIVTHPGWLLALKGVLSAALLLGPTMLMGGTLPLLAAWLQKSSADAGRRSARFYSVNSLGAVVGAALAGFFLVQRFGMIATLQITAVVNLLVGGMAVWVGQVASIASDSTPASQPVQPASSSAPASGLAAMPVLPMFEAGLLVALTGAVSMGFEVLASRSLALIFGSSLQSFAVVLIAFILGIGLGAAWIASPRRRRVSSEAMVILLLCLAAAWVAFLVFNIERWVDFYRIARTGLARTPAGYVYHQLLTTGIALVILGLPAAWIGAVLPLMIRAVSAEGELLGKKVGALLTWNTLGAVTGTLLTGFVLMPLAGLRHAFGGLALVLAGVGLLIAWRRGWRIGLAGSFITCMFVGSLFVVGDADWRNVMSSGIFRVWETRFEPRLMPIRKEHIKLLFYEDGPDATVSVEQTDGIIAPASIGLRINGKPDAGTSVDLCNQLLLAHLPLLVKPQAENVFVLGFGSGMTAGAALEYPNVHLDVAENCDSVLRAGKYFADWNRHVLSDPRATIWREDARTVLKLRPQMYDVMITEPSNPWTVGVGSVFSREFYELAARRLKPGGIIAQWFHLYETDDATVDLVMRTFGSVFPNMEIWDTGGGDLVILGSMQPWSTGAMAFARGFAINRVRTDLAMIDIHSPEALLARQLASQRTAFAIAGAGPLQSDFFPILEYHAPEAFFIGGRSSFLDRYDERTFRQLLAPPDKNHALRGLTLAAAQQVFRDFSSINGQLYGCLFGAPTSAEIPCGLPTPQPAPPPATTGSILNLCIGAIARGDLEQARQGVAYALQLEPENPDAAYLKRVIDRHFGNASATSNAKRLN